MSYAVQTLSFHPPLHSTSKSLQKYTFFFIHNRLGIFFFAPEMKNRKLLTISEIENGELKIEFSILHFQFSIFNFQFSIKKKGASSTPLNNTIFYIYYLMLILSITIFLSLAACRPYTVSRTASVLKLWLTWPSGTLWMVRPDFCPLI